MGTNDFTLGITVFDGMNTPYYIDLMQYGKESISVGRAYDNDIVLQSPLVSKYHMQFVIRGECVDVYDNNSTNGMYVEKVRVQSARLQNGNVIKVMIDREDTTKNVCILFSMGSLDFCWRSVDVSQLLTITIGRDEGCSIVLKNSSISKVHATIKRQSDGYYLYSYKNTGSIVVNGNKVDKYVKLCEKDIILIANTKMVFSSFYFSYVTYDSGIRVEADHVVKTVRGPKGKLNIVNDISLTIKPGEFVAIIGGSGAGKSSFMNCISGYSKPTTGQVRVNGEDLYENYETLKQVIGYVPQADIVYDNLSVQSMLEYAAKLRMPKDTTRAERKEKVSEVIHMVELQGKEKAMIKRLSGGQKKRVSIAVELLSDPNLFFLDEPSSGLDPGTEEKLMETLKKMSTMGKTIILITHNTMNIHLCDKIIFLGKGGNLCYFGTPSEAYNYFGVQNMVRVYNMVTDNSEYWKSVYVNTNGLQAQSGASTGGSVKSASRPSRRGSIMNQTSILTSRYFNLMFHDMKRLLMLIFQAPLLGFLLYLVADSKVFEQYEITKAILFAVSCCAFWIGILNSIQEVCKERNILKREYLSGLSLCSYVISKFIVLGFFCLIQSGLLIGTFAALVGMPQEGVFLPVQFEIFFTTFLTALSATAMGLFVSSLFKNADRAMTVAPILLMPQILFSGLAFSLKGVIEKVSYVVTCRWAMEAYGSIANLNDLTLKIQETLPEMEHSAENFYTYSPWHLCFAWEILIGFTVIFGIMSYVALTNVEK